MLHHLPRRSRRGVIATALIACTFGLLPAPSAIAAPSAPTNVAVTRGEGSLVDVTWTAATGATRYTVRAYKDATNFVTWDVCGAAAGSDTSCSPSDPLNVPRTEPAWIEVDAEDATTSTPSARIALPAYPGTPTAGAITAADGGLIANWTASVAGASATSFTASAYATATGGSAVSSCTAATSPCTIPTLTNGTTYYVEVSATAGVGSSEPSARIAGTPVGTATAPASLTVTGGDGIITASWTVPASTGGGAITGYLAEAFTTESGGTAVATCEPASLSAMRCDLQGLTNGTAYYVSVTARTATGPGTPTARSSVSPGLRPTTPRSVQVLRGDGLLEVSWAAPASDGGSPITGYSARAYTSSSSSATVAASCTSTGEHTCTIGGVVNATTYYVSVTASTAVGESPASSRVTSTAVSQPTPPRSVSVTRGNGFAVVNWRAPENTGGARIEKYVAKAYRTPTDDAVLAECSPQTSALRCDIGPLPNGSTYYIDVVAITSRFTSAPSSPREAVLTATTPSPPREVTAVQDGANITVSWKVPLADGGQHITKYVATAFSSSVSKTVVTSCTTSGDTCSLTKASGPPVFISVTASNAIGESAASEPRVKVVIGDAPRAPTEVTAVRNGGVVRVGWQPSTPTGGRAVSGYTVTAFDTTKRLLGSCRILVVKPASSARRTCAMRGIAPRTSGTIVVAASNGLMTTDSTPIPLPGSKVTPLTPTGVVALPAESSLVVTSNRATNDHGAFTYEFVAWSKATGGDVRSRCTSLVSADAPTCTLRGLGNYQVVWVSAIARHGSTASTPSTRVEAKPMASPASAVRNIEVTPGVGTLRVAWQAPLTDGGYAITSYRVTATTASSEGSVLGTCTAKPTQRTCTITGLKTDFAYVSVMPINPVSDGPASAPIGRNLPPA